MITKKKIGNATVKSSKDERIIHYLIVCRPQLLNDMWTYCFWFYIIIIKEVRFYQPLVT